MKKVMVLGILLISSFCYAMDSWIGSHQSAVIRAWGPPTRITTDGNGGKILIYERESGSKYTTEGDYETKYILGQVVREYHPGHEVDNTYIEIRMFYVNRKGFVYYWKMDSR